MNKTNIATNQRLDSLEARITKIESSLKGIAAPRLNTKSSKWMTELSARRALKLKTGALRELRKDNIIRSSTASENEIKYWRADVDKLLVAK